MATIYITLISINVFLLFCQLLTFPRSVNKAPETPEAPKAPQAISQLVRAIKHEHDSHATMKLELDEKPNVTSRQRWANRKVMVPQAAIDSLRIRPFDEFSLRLTAHTSDLFDITAAQRQRIHLALDNALAKVKEIEKNSAVLVEDPDGSQFYRIPFFEAEGAEIMVQLQSDLVSAVGENLGWILAKKSEYLFARMGQLRQEVFFYKDENGKFRFVNRKYKPDGKEFQSMQTLRLDDFRHRFGHLLDLSRFR